MSRSIFAHSRAAARGRAASRGVARVRAIAMESGNARRKELTGRGGEPGAAPDPYDGAAVNGEVQGLTHADVVERRLGRVELKPFCVGRGIGVNDACKAR